MEQKIEDGEFEESMRAMGLPAVVWPTMGLEGPFGAPAQGYDNFKVLMLVGAGIGVTPFASILSEIAHRFQELQCPNCNDINYHNFPIKKVYFYFMSRDQKEFSWFKDTLESIVLADNQCRIECHQYITSVESESDIRSAAIKMVQNAAIDMGKDDSGVRVSRGDIELQPQSETSALLKEDAGPDEQDEAEAAPATGLAGKDFLTGMEANIPLHFGRPDWSKIFKQVKKNNPDEEVGVFFCGAPIIGKALDHCSDIYSDTVTGRKEFVNEEGDVEWTQEGTNFVYHEEHF
eukprot:TRINITY_DN18016_c0_g6_i4.p1 TRINITY_DN18016_c0_g6~~TRINITY_DN18016_c0_g6_i4.p1  ORF type:complete len:290 (-),score=68.27 TRINITY_DN18016_c0_g6_i4:131-1000(-)